MLNNVSIICSKSVNLATQSTFRIPFRSIYNTVTLLRNKNEIYNSNDRPDAILDADFRVKVKLKAKK